MDPKTLGKAFDKLSKAANEVEESLTDKEPSTLVKPPCPRPHWMDGPDSIYTDKRFSGDDDPDYMAFLVICGPKGVGSCYYERWLELGRPDKPIQYSPILSDRPSSTDQFPPMPSNRHPKSGRLLTDPAPPLPADFWTKPIKL